MLKTKRLILHQVNISDRKFIVEYLSDDDQAKYLPLDRAYSDIEAQKWFDLRLKHWSRHNFGTFIIYVNSLHSAIGYCGIEHVKNTRLIDIRYGITKQFWGHGYAHESALAVIHYGFSDLCVEKLYGAAVPQNIPSIKLLEKIGMERDNCFYEYGEEVSHYSLTAERYNKVFRDQEETLIKGQYLNS